MQMQLCGWVQWVGKVGECGEVRWAGTPACPCIDMHMSLRRKGTGRKSRVLDALLDGEWFAKVLGERVVFKAVKVVGCKWTMIHKGMDQSQNTDQFSLSNSNMDQGEQQRPICNGTRR
jgi:hypothetical protein